MSKMVCYMPAPNLSTLLALLAKTESYNNRKRGLQWWGGMVRSDKAGIRQSVSTPRRQRILGPDKDAGRPF